MQRPAVVHPLWLRISHWIHAIAALALAASGGRIDNASPILPFRFPEQITLGDWLGAAIQWHFAAMWLLAINGAAYLLISVATGRLYRNFLPPYPRGVVRDHDMAQKAVCAGVTAALGVAALSGLAVWKPVQFPLLCGLMGGFGSARVVHFGAMAVIVAFLAVHLAMAALAPPTLPTRRGR